MIPVRCSCPYGHLILCLGGAGPQGWQPGYGPQPELELLPSCLPSGGPAAYREGLDASNPSLASPGLPLFSHPTATCASEVVLLRQGFTLHCLGILQTLGVRPGTQTGVYMQGEHLCERRAKDTLEHQAQVSELAFRQGTWTF